MHVSAGAAIRKRSMHIHFVYVLQSQAHPEHYYVGLTSDIASRVASHNAGTTQSTRPYRPWKLLLYMAFFDDKKARRFEVYLKSGSGRAFCKRHF